MDFHTFNHRKYTLVQYLEMIKYADELYAQEIFQEAIACHISALIELDKIKDTIVTTFFISPLAQHHLKVIDKFAKEMEEILKIKNKSKRNKKKKKLAKRKDAYFKTLTPYEIESDQSGEKYISTIIKDPISEAVQIANKLSHLDIKPSKHAKKLCLSLLELYILKRKNKFSPLYLLPKKTLL